LTNASDSAVDQANVELTTSVVSTSRHPANCSALWNPGGSDPRKNLRTV
jgi:hypothetical protein